jgi:NAD(P)-dependent dehydrogenase (short-subunit alcohol dehydrogenase family)
LRAVERFLAEFLYRCLSAFQRTNQIEVLAPMNDSHSSTSFSIDLRGQVALVTGAASGLGRRFARVLSSCGASVALASRRIDRLTTLEREIRDSGGHALAVQLDVRDPSAIRACLDRVQAELGLVSILVNNAAAMNSQRAVDLSLDTIDDLINTNLRAPFLLSIEVARRLIDNGKPGRIVNISSVGAYRQSVDATMSLYSTTKSGIQRMTETLAVEWAKNRINVNAIAPGLFRTEMGEDYIKEHEAEIIAPFPRHRVGEPPQLDSTLLYLVSPSSDFVTGICLLVDDAQYSR